MFFTIETKQNNKISFLDASDIREQGKYTTTVYRKPTFSGVYTHFDSSLPNTHKIGMIYKMFPYMLYWSMFHSQLTLLRKIFQKNDNPENFIYRHFKF